MYFIAMVVAFLTIFVMIARTCRSWYSIVLGFNQPEAISFIIFCIPFMLVLVVGFTIFCVMARR